MALMVLGWMRDCSEEDMPPQHMWLNDAALSDHWENVRNSKGGHGDGGPDGPLEQNDFTKDLR